MARILLLHTNRSYAEKLAEVVSQTTIHQAEVVSRVPISERLQVLAGRDYDLVQADELMINGVLSAGASALFNIPLVVAIRGWADYTNTHGQYGILRDGSIYVRSRAILRQTSEVLFISEITKEKFSKRYPISQYTVVGRPVDVERYSSGIPSGRETFDLLTATNLRYEQKYEGILTVLRALEPLFERDPTLRYRIAGAGQYLTKLKAFLREYEHADRVTVLGFVDAIEDEYASADAFVYVSFLDSYATVVLEAQAAGLPVIGGDAVGVPEAVGDAGAICRPTPEGVRRALDRLVTDKKYREKLAKKSCKKMSKHNEECAAKHVNVWEKSLDE